MTRKISTSRWISALVLLPAVALVAGCAGTANSPAVSTRVTEVSVPGAETTETVGTAMNTSEAADGPSGFYTASEVTGHEIVEGTTIQIVFEDGQLGVEAGCNSMGSAYTIDDGKLIVEQFISTMMACDEPLMEQEQWVSAFLSAGPMLEMQGDTVMLTGVGIVPETMTLVPGAAEEPLRVDTAVWQLDTIEQGAAASSVPVGVEATMQIVDGRLVLSAGCNTINGAVLVEEDSLTVEPLVSTRMACPEDVAAIETLFITVFEGTVPIAVEGNELRVTGADTTLVFIGEEVAAGTSTATPSESVITDSTIPATGTETATTVG